MQDPACYSAIRSDQGWHLNPTFWTIFGPGFFNASAMLCVHAMFFWFHVISTRCSFAE